MSEQRNTMPVNPATGNDAAEGYQHSVQLSTEEAAELADLIAGAGVPVHVEGGKISYVPTNNNQNSVDK